MTKSPPSIRHVDSLDWADSCLRPDPWMLCCIMTMKRSPPRIWPSLKLSNIIYLGHETRLDTYRGPEDASIINEKAANDVCLSVLAPYWRHDAGFDPFRVGYRVRPCPVFRLIWTSPVPFCKRTCTPDGTSCQNPIPLRVQYRLLIQPAARQIYGRVRKFFLDCNSG